MSEAISGYEALIRSGTAQDFPIFEIQNTQNVVLTVAGKGYGGIIWGKFLVDRNTLEIYKAAFEHKAESEGYGAGISLSAFENQFAGATVHLEENTFGLDQGGKTVVPGKHPIDGVSGATVSSMAVADMANSGLKKYKNYFNPQ